MPTVTVVLVLAAAAILGGVVLVALGRGGEMTRWRGDRPPLDLGVVRPGDVALLRPPMSLWGYNAEATDEALRAIAQSLVARDREVAALRRELAQSRPAWRGVPGAAPRVTAPGESGSGTPRPGESGPDAG